MEITVLHLTGWAGTGKTTLLQKFSAENPGSIQILTPESSGQMFDPSAADLVSHSAVAIDDVPSWDRASVAQGIASLEVSAEQCGKKLILVSQAQQDLDRTGVVLRKAPAIMRLGGQQQTLSLSYDGQHLSFAATQAN